MPIPYAPDKSWNWMTGCTKESEGCVNCWAEETVQRHKDLPGYSHDKPFTVTFHPKRVEQPLHWRKPSVIAECLMGDQYHKDVPRPWRNAAWAVKRDCPRHTFIACTKRPLCMVAEVMRLQNTPQAGMLGQVKRLENVWHGISVENQKTADNRVPFVEHVDEGWLSCEPMLGPIDWPTEFYYAKGVIVGAESGPNARPFDPKWAEVTLEACRRSGTKFYLKQLPTSMGGANWDKWPESLKHLKVRQLPWKL